MRGAECSLSRISNLAGKVGRLATKLLGDPASIFIEVTLTPKTMGDGESHYSEFPDYPSRHIDEKNNIIVDEKSYDDSLDI